MNRSASPRSTWWRCIASCTRGKSVRGGRRAARRRRRRSPRAPSSAPACGRGSRAGGPTASRRAAPPGARRRPRTTTGRWGRSRRTAPRTRAGRPRTPTRIRWPGAGAARAPTAPSARRVDHLVERDREAQVAPVDRPGLLERREVGHHERQAGLVVGGQRQVVAARARAARGSRPSSRTARRAAGERASSAARRTGRRPRRRPSRTRTDRRRRTDARRGSVGSSSPVLERLAQRDRERFEHRLQRLEVQVHPLAGRSRGVRSAEDAVQPGLGDDVALGRARQLLELVALLRVTGVSVVSPSSATYPAT